MDTLQEIKAAIDTLTASDRRKLAYLLRESVVPELPRIAHLPDQAARRRQILGDKVLVNMVLQERAAETR